MNCWCGPLRHTEAQMLLPSLQSCLFGLVEGENTCICLVRVFTFAKRKSEQGYKKEFVCEAM